MNVVFQCTDGPQTLISRIIFIGNRAFQPEPRCAKSSHPANPPGTASSRAPTSMIRDRVEYDEYLLHQFYLHKGYADFNIVSANAELSPDRKSFYLTFDFRKGRATASAASRSSRASARSDMRKLRGLVPLAAGDWFDGDALQEGVTRSEQARAQSRLSPSRTVNPMVADPTRPAKRIDDHAECRQRPACLYPAHRRHRQHPDRGSGDPP